MKKPIFLLLSLGLTLFPLLSRPVDLSAPDTELGVSTKDGFLSLHRELGEIDFGKELILPFRLFFQSSPQTTSACFATSGWTIPVMDSKTTFLDENRIEVFLPCGKTTYFIKNLATGKFKSIDGEWEGTYDQTKEKLTITRDDGWEIDWIKGKIKRLKNDEGRELIWDYDSGSPLLIKEGQNKVFELTRVKKRVEMIRIGSKEYRLKYDPLGRLEEVKWPSGRKESYQWSFCSKGNPILKMVTKEGREESFSWDRKEGYILTDRVWGYTIEEMEPEKELKEDEVPLVKISRVNKFGQKESYFNDKEKGEVTTERADGLKILLTRFVTPGKIYHKTRKIEHTEKGTTKTVYQASYDEGGRLIREIDAMGNETKFSYVLEGTGDAAKIKSQTKTDALGGKWITEFNADEYPISIINPLNEKTTYEWDPKRHLVSLTNALEIKVATFTYDDRGLVTELKDALQNKIEFSYNEDKKLIQVKDAAEQLWKTERNEEGEAIALVNPLNQRMELERNQYGKVKEVKDALGNKSRYQYDSMSRLKELKDANGNQTQWQWDELDRVTEKVDANRQVIQIGYDLMNRENKIVDPLNRAYQIAYQKFGDRTEFKFTDGVGQNYQYDDNGNLIQFTNRAGSVFKYKYDKLDRLIETKWADGTCIKYGYDSVGRMLRAEKFGSTPSLLTFHYDAAGRLTSENQNGKSVGYAYNANSQLTQITYPSGRIVSYAYDSRGMTSSITTSEGAFIYERDALGQVTKKTNPNQTNTEQSYDAGQRLTSMTLKDSGAKSLWSNQYKFDKVGNRTSTEYLDGKKDLYDYDNLYQITGVTYGVESKKKAAKEENHFSPAETLDFERFMKGEKEAKSEKKNRAQYKYDSVGNRRFALERGKASAYSVNALNQYVSSGKSFYKYNTRGDLTSDGTWTYSYDLLGNLVGASNGSTVIKFEFDALNRRVSKTVQGEKEEYLYSSLDRIADMSGTQLKAEYVFEEGIDRPVMMKKGTEVFFIQQDILGNVVSLVGTDSKIKESISYEVFGLPTIKDEQGNAKNSSLSPFLFTAREYDSEIGIYHYRARAYSPILGRFMQLDPIDLKAGDMNPYRYVGNSSLNYLDSYGLFAIVIAIPIYELICGTLTLIGTALITISAGQNFDPSKLESKETEDKSRESKPKDAPPGTVPIDKSGLDKEQIHDVKDGVGAGPKDWTGITPKGDVITSGQNGNAVNHGPAGQYTN